MAQEIEISRRTALPSLSLPASLSEVIADQTAPSMAGSVGIYGYEAVPVPWELKLPISVGDVAAAKALLPLAEAACELAKPDDGRTWNWLLMLGAITAGRTSMDDAKVKLTAYRKLLEVPVGIFDDETVMRRAGKRFKFFPSFSELAEFIEAERRRLDQQARRLRIVAFGRDQEPARGFRVPVRRMATASKMNAAPASEKPVPPTPVAVIIEENTTSMTQDQRKNYWGARLEGKSVDEARAIALSEKAA